MSSLRNKSEFEPKSSFSLAHRLRRLVWGGVWLVLFRPSPRVCFAWRRLILSLFGARLAPSSRVHNSTKIWAPWNLVMGERSILADDVDCYNVDRVTLGDEAIVSQYAYLCTASHDISDPAFALRTKPIVLGRSAWVAARAMVTMGVTVGEGGVIAGGAVVSRNVDPWTVVAGNPAQVIKKRIVRSREV